MTLPYPAQLLAHSRNFGSFAAVRSGLAAARGDLFGVMAADLQFSFTDLPIRLLIRTALAGSLLSLLLGMAVVARRSTNKAHPRPAALTLLPSDSATVPS